MRRLSGFSLMEMMVVLLIVAVVAAAAAPMINRKMVESANNDCPWERIRNGIAYNTASDTSSAVIGDSTRPNTNPRLFVNVRENRNPNITLGRAGNNMNIFSGENSVFISNTTPVAFHRDSIQIGGNGIQNASTNTIAIGSAAKALGQYGIAVGISSNAMDTAAVSIGLNSLAGSNAVAVGNRADAQAKGIAIGGALDGDASHRTYAGANAIAIGTVAHAGGAKSIAIGVSSTADSKEAIAIGSNTDTAKGASAGADYSIAIGNASAAAMENNIAIGHSSKANEDQNIVIGANSSSTKGESIVIGPNLKINHRFATAVGQDVEILGENGTAIGHACKAAHGSTAIGQGARATGEVSTAIGLNVDARHYRSIAIGASTTAANQIALGGPSRTVLVEGNIQVNGTHSTTSDRRLKNVGEAFKGGLEEIKKLEVFNYTYKDDKKKTPRVGVIAQDLQKIFPKAVIKGEDGFLSIRMEDMFYAVINAIKELDVKINILEQKQKKIDELEAKINKLEKRLEKLEK